jgi:predicted glycoside hydrolase/deacetylase ChbG (UPF0249 family)
VSLSLAVTADDFGYCQERNDGIMRAFAAGSVTDACLLPAFPTSLAAIAAAEAVSLPLGLHLNLTEGVPVSPAALIPSLVTRAVACECSGGDAVCACAPHFRGKFEFFEAVEHGKVLEEDIRREVRAQIEWFREHVGYAPHHVAGHNHFHVHPRVARVLAPLFVEAGNLPVRWSEVCEVEGALLDGWPERPREFLRRIHRLSAESTPIYDAAGVPRNVGFVGIALSGRFCTIEHVREILETQASALRSLGMEKNGVAGAGTESGVFCEFMCHPGLAQVSGGDDFSRSTERELELALVSSTAFRESILDAGFRLVSWRDGPRRPSKAG